MVMCCPGVGLCSHALISLLRPGHKKLCCAGDTLRSACEEASGADVSHPVLWMLSFIAPSRGSHSCSGLLCGEGFPWGWMLRGPAQWPHSGITSFKWVEKQGGRFPLHMFLMDCFMMCFLCITILTMAFKSNSAFLIVVMDDHRDV